MRSQLAHSEVCNTWRGRMKSEEQSILVDVRDMLFCIAKSLALTLYCCSSEAYGSIARQHGPRHFEVQDTYSNGVEMFMVQWSKW